MNIKYKKIKTITKIQQKEKVVNFSVKNNENYFANRILTHNCYVKRHNSEFITVAKNNGDILTAVNNHVTWLPEKTPNQTHEKYYTYDLGCNSDLSLHYKQLKLEYIFDFFKQHPTAMGSFATKYVNKKLLAYNPDGKIRIRFSLMPQEYANILEPKTSSILDRIKAIDTFIAAGYDVHINFSPVIVQEGWLEKYKELFELVNEYVVNKDKVKAEVIFLTHNAQQHDKNLLNNSKAEELLWKPSIQEGKVSQYGGKNIRYKYNLKQQYIQQFIDLHNEIISWCTIRYIF